MTDYSAVSDRLQVIDETVGVTRPGFKS
jgi:hypothetical protein